MTRFWSSVRIVCCVHPRFARTMFDIVRDLEPAGAYLENARSVRQRHRPRPFGLPGKIVRREESPLDMYYLHTDPARTDRAVSELIERLSLEVPGRGTLFTQRVSEFIEPPSGAVPPGEHEQLRLPVLRGLALVTAVLSGGGSCDQIAQISLDLGTAVPVVTIGTGTGVRDRLGLLRITIPPEKEIVQLLVPGHDAETIMAQLIEEGRLDRPGKGFLYYTPVVSGILDTRLHIGPQTHSASMEQVIAAIDELKAGTSWRKRFLPQDETEKNRRFLSEHSEIAFVCPENRTAGFVDAALTAGARGATTVRVKRIRTDPADTRSNALERSIITIPASLETAVTEALRSADERDSPALESLQVLPAPAAFAHRG